MEMSDWDFCPRRSMFKLCPQMLHDSCEFRSRKGLFDTSNFCWMCRRLAVQGCDPEVVNAVKVELEFYSAQQVGYIGNPCFGFWRGSKAHDPCEATSEIRMHGRASDRAHRPKWAKRGFSAFRHMSSATTLRSSLVMSSASSFGLSPFESKMRSKMSL